MTFHYKFLLFFALCFGSLTTLSAQTFEGEVKMTFNDLSRKESGAAVCKIKGANWLVTYQTQDSAYSNNYKVLIRGTEKLLYLFNDANNDKAWAVPFSSVKPSASFGQVTVTAETKTVAGYACKKVLVDNGSTKTEFWICETLNIDFSALNSLKSGANGWGALAANNIKGTPLEIKTTDANGKVVSQQQITAVQTGSVADKDVAVPGNLKLQNAEMLKKELSTPQSK